MRQVMQIDMPTGGVISPIMRLSVNITPKWTGSMPSVLISGIRTGTSRIISDSVSRKQPRTSRITLRTSRMMNGSVDTEVTRRTSCGPACSRVSTQASSAEAATMNITVAVVMAASPKMAKVESQVSSR